MLFAHWKSHGGKKGLTGLGLRAVLGVAVLLIASVGAALALSPVVDLSQNQQNVKITGMQDNSYLGEVTGSADFNKDGYADLLLGAGGFRTNGDFSGAAFVILGGANMPATIDAVNANFKIYGDNETDALGHALAAGDVNGDGYTDMIVAADAYGANRGAVYVVLGSSSISGTLDLNTAQASMIIIGAADGDRFGRSVASADVNNDNFDDIIVGAYRVSSGGKADRGAVYVILGQSSLPLTMNLQTTPAALTILGSAGDTDGPASPQLALSGASVLFEEEIASTDAVDEIGDRLGRSVAAADVNGDGFGDIIAGAYGANVSGKADAGRTYVFHGSGAISNSAPAVIDLGSGGSANAILEGVDAGDQSGFYVAGGDLNKDNKAEVIVGAYFGAGSGNAAGAEAGEVYVVSGNNLSGTSSLTAAIMKIYGAAAGDRLGRSLAVGDVDEDTYQDLVIGASRASPGGRLAAGAVYTIMGRANLSATLVVGVGGGANVTILGDGDSGVICGDEEQDNNSKDCADEAGHATSVGDVNGDGAADIIVGALYANPTTPALQDAGISYIIYGGSMITQPPPNQTNKLNFPVAINNSN